MDKRSQEKIMNLEIYTDGSLKKLGQSTFGGWSFLVLRDSHLCYSRSGGEINTTNQRMELQAIVEALTYASTIRHASEKVILYSDSAYAINCYEQKWYLGWKANGWINSKRQEVANQDLWVQIIPYFDNFWYSFKKVKGHANVLWNEECDRMAQEEAEYRKLSWRGKTNV